MMSALWVVLFVALVSSHCGYGLPVRPTPQDYPHDGHTNMESWGLEGGLYAAIPVLALVLTAVVLIFGCTWCYRHKDCKPNEGTDNQLFTASASHLHTAQRVLPPSGFPEPANNNINEDNNNGPISLREMQNIANNNATAYIVSENEERNRYSRESIVEFEPLPAPFINDDPLERCADWFGDDDFPRNNLQYLREIGRGWFGRVVVGEIEGAGTSTNVAVKILNQNASLEQKAQFLDEAKMYRDGEHENLMAFVGKCLQEEPWILMFELCTVDLQQYLISNRPNMAMLNENGVPLRLMCDVTSALAYLHSRGITYGQLWVGGVFTRDNGSGARAVLGRYITSEPQYQSLPPEVAARTSRYTTSSEIWSLGTLIWEICAWGSVPTDPPCPPSDLPCPYKDHLYQVMQLCWNSEPSGRPTASQVHALISHLHVTASHRQPLSDMYASHFEDRWERLKPNSIPKLDEHVAIVHAPSASTSASASRYSDRESDHNTLGIDTDMVVSRSSSIMSDRDPLSVQLKSESMTNLHGSLEDVRNIYLTHNETPALECHQGNILEDARERERDRSDGSVDPWLKDIIAGSQDDVSYYRDVSDVIKNLDNILNSEKTSSSESSHQASPSRDNLSLDCKKEYPAQSSLVKSPGITNFQNILDTGFGGQPGETEPCLEEEEDRDTIGTLSHSFERHSDSTSQHTLENVTPDTPMKDFDVVVDIEPLIASEAIVEVEKRPEEVKDDVVETNKSVEQDTELPKVVDSNVPKLKVLCVASMPSVSESNELSLVKKDCQTSCDNVTEIRTDCEETKSIDDVRESTTECKPLDETEVTDSVQSLEQIEMKDEIVLPISADEVMHSIGVDTLPSVTDETSTTTQDNTSNIKLESNLEDIEPYSIESENNYSKDETILVSDLIDTVTDSSKDEQLKNHEKLVKVDIEIDTVTEQTPDSVQNIIDDKQETADLKLKQKADTEIIKHIEIMPTKLPPEIVQNTNKPVAETEVLVNKEVVDVKNDSVDNKDSGSEIMNRSDSYVVMDAKEQSSDSTVYMDLINNTNSQILNDSTVDNVREMNLGGDFIPPNISTIDTQDSTAYLELPSFKLKKETDEFLQMERAINSIHFEGKIIASTPITSDNSTETVDKTVENSLKEETMILSETKVLDVSETKQNNVPENISPFESPSHKSHHTDTYDENSSVVLGPFENSAEIFKSKSNIDPVELPKEELLAFSSNFSEMNLATPSPLRDGNFLNEVPDIVPDDSQIEDLASISEPKLVAEVSSEDTEGSESGTQKRISPSTPPNSPGIFLASTSQQNYLVDIDLNAEHEPEPAPTIDLNQIELQITSKLAMAENENNFNIEYSGPLTVEGLIEEGGAMRESDAIPESYLAGNGGSVEDVREEVSLNEECVKALRNELELKLPLAQVAAIEPQCESDGECQPELPPPPELVVCYVGALSPIVEETGQQLSAYENDTNWNPCTRTDSSESYPEPCNMSSESCTEAPHTAASPRTYTLPHDTSKPAQRDLTSFTDSLNASPQKSHQDTAQSPIDDRTYVKDDDKESNCERISQVSPFLVSPTTDTSDNDNATRVSTLSKTTLPTDAKHSKPDTQCLSKATSIDSWCSNDTLYNVEENFDDLAMDSDLPVEYDKNHDRDEHSDSTDTLTHNDDKELSHCSTYIIHDSKSEACDTFSPDSITANDNYTYTKVKTDAAATTPSVITKSDLNDSTKNTQTKDLAYGTLLSGIPSCSNCTTEVASGFDDIWKLPQPELVRRSPMGHEDINITPKQIEDESCDLKDYSSPQLSKPHLKKMDSVEIQCLRDLSADSSNEYENRDVIVINESPEYNYKHMTPSVTSTPLYELEAGENMEVIPMTLPEPTPETSASIINVPTFLTFQQSAEVRPQDLSTTNNATQQEGEVLLEGMSETISRNSNRDSAIVSERTPTFSDFENSAVTKPQSVTSRDRSSQSQESGINSEEFRNFENSVKYRPQDLSSLIDASSLLLKSERMSSDLAMIESKTLSRISNVDGSVASERPTTYSDFENSAICKPQCMNSRYGSNQSTESGVNSEEFRSFENSVKDRPQDLSSLKDASSSLLKSERISSEIAMASITGLENQTSHRNNSNEPMQSLDLSPPSITNLIESHELVVTREPSSALLINFHTEDETEQPHSIIVTEVPINSITTSPNRTYDSHIDSYYVDFNNHTYDSHESKSIFSPPKINGDLVEQPQSLIMIEEKPSTSEANQNEKLIYNDKSHTECSKDLPNGTWEMPKSDSTHDISEEIQVNGGSERYATVNFLNETFEELLESSVDDSDSKEDKLIIDEDVPTPEVTRELASETEEILSPVEHKSLETSNDALAGRSTETHGVKANGVAEEDKITTVTEDFLQNEKKYATFNSYFPMLSDIRFTGPGTEMMSTSFQDSPTSPTSPECEQDSKPNTAAEILKEWDSDSESHSSNSSSGEFIWKDGAGHETSVVTTSHFEHQRGSGTAADGANERGSGSGASEGSGESGSGSEGDEVEFVPSSWDCRAAPSKSSLRSLEATPDSKKRVVFKRQKYHCVYEYPREVTDPGAHSPAYLPDFSTYCEWDPTSAEEAELCYGQLFSSPSPLAGYPLRAGIAFGADYDEDFFISSSARPFESLGIMSTTSQFFPGKRALLERSLSDESPLQPSPPPVTSLDLTTPDSGVEDITPSSTLEEEFKRDEVWRVDGSSSESASPGSPASESLGGLRHTRDRLKLDLPPSPHAASPKHARVFSFALEKPKRREVSTPLVMTDETPVLPPLPPHETEPPAPEPTFSTFGKTAPKTEPEQKIILTDETAEPEVESPKVVEGVKGEGTVLDSGDEDSGIESSSKATLERNGTPNVS